MWDIAAPEESVWSRVCDRVMRTCTERCFSISLCLVLSHSRRYQVKLVVPEAAMGALKQQVAARLPSASLIDDAAGSLVTLCLPAPRVLVDSL